MFLCVPIVLELTGLIKFYLLSLKSWAVYGIITNIISAFIKFIRMLKQQ